MPPELALPSRLEAEPVAAWRGALMRLAAAWLALFALTAGDWAAMAHQWWNIDTYNHVLLIPLVLGWLVWLRRSELIQVSPTGWPPGLLWLAGALALWLAGRALEVNLVAQVGVLGAFQGAALALLGLRASLLLAFPLAYALFLVPFGDELVPALQAVTARIAIALTHLSGVPAAIDGLYIDTPAGRFVVAEECSGVKFLIAMTALSVLAAWTGFARWRVRAAFVLGAALVSILANGVRAWATIFVAQYVGAQRAGGFDHIVYGWVFFALVIALTMGAAWRFFDREPAEAGWTAREIEALPLARFSGPKWSANAVFAMVCAAVIGFAALALAV